MGKRHVKSVILYYLCTPWEYLFIKWQGICLGNDMLAGYYAFEVWIILWKANGAGGLVVEISDNKTCNIDTTVNNQSAVKISTNQLMTLHTHNKWVYKGNKNVQSVRALNSCMPWLYIHIWSKVLVVKHETWKTTRPHQSKNCKMET